MVVSAFSLSLFTLSPSYLLFKCRDVLLMAPYIWDKDLIGRSLEMWCLYLKSTSWFFSGPELIDCMWLYSECHLCSLSSLLGSGTFFLQKKSLQCFCHVMFPACVPFYISVLFLFSFSYFHSLGMLYSEIPTGGGIATDFLIKHGFIYWDMFRTILFNLESPATLPFSRILYRLAGISRKVHSV